MRIDKSLVAIITGGASGLGQATVRLLRKQGAQVVIADMNQSAGLSIAQQLGCLFFKTDVTDQQNVQKLFQFTLQKYKSIHVVVNCAGISAPGSIIYSKGVYSSQKLINVLKINVVGTFNLSKHGAKYMSLQNQVNGERGVIINVASVAAFQGQQGQVGYSASKGAIVGMTLPMARDLGKYKIRVMTIAPGVFKTAMGNRIPQKVLNTLLNSTPLNSLGKSDSFALSVKSIIQNPYATGTTWRLDGGIRLGYL